MIITVVLCAQSISVYARNDNCWVEIYDDTQFKGKHIRLKGSVKLKNLIKVQGSNWDKKIESIVVGPKATLTVFEKKL